MIVFGLPQGAGATENSTAVQSAGAHGWKFEETLSCSPQQPDPCGGSLMYRASWFFNDDGTGFAEITTRGAVLAQAFNEGLGGDYFPLEGTSHHSADILAWHVDSSTGDFFLDKTIAKIQVHEHPIYVDEPAHDTGIPALELHLTEQDVYGVHIPGVVFMADIKRV
jgi:hypothetical protein